MKLRLRSLFALVMAATLVWDYSRDSDAALSRFSNWALILHFTYFQLPRRSRAHSFAHAIAFVASVTTALHYLAYLLLQRSSYSTQNIATSNSGGSGAGSGSWSGLIRIILVQFVPLIFHIVDTTTRVDSIVTSYRQQQHNSRTSVAWVIVSYGILCVLFDTLASAPGVSDMNVDSTDSTDIEGVNEGDVLLRNNSIETRRMRFVTSLVFFVCGFFLLTMLVLRHAFPLRTTKRSLSRESIQQQQQQQQQ